VREEEAGQGREVPWPAGRGLDGSWRYGRLLKKLKDAGEDIERFRVSLENPTLNIIC
jgi:hypothetical protein